MPPTTPSRRNEVIDWYASLPITTRFLLSAMVTTTTVSSLGFVNPSSLILYWPDVKYRLQIWRLVSCFFVNRLSLDFAFNAYFFYTNSLQLETHVFQSQPADYVFFHLFTGGLQLIAASVLKLYVLSDGILLSTIYLLSQHFRDSPVWFMFGIRLKALYLPWAIIAQKFVMSGGDIPKSSIAGLLSAHLYYYLTTIYPSQGGRRFLQTPDFIKQLFVTRPRNPATNVFGRHTWGSGRRLDS
ncbi:hypothetical protein G6F56_005223 [Rhizopus delemar]|uniref:Derlin n=1 Tax=Rhizopus stolonifer TaxID=4846 RepID=A0A367JUV3_RHIST|nr:hypothetical protein G6F56_005223 [Rhizopus delemar]RCH93629.1 hypothetical protein CU098_008586 [Rhizopus stolonifer]